MSDITKIAEELGKLTVLEAAELVKHLEEEWGVSAARASWQSAVSRSRRRRCALLRRKTEFDVVLAEVRR